MNILIFDMDGVLLNPQGYHRALKETVRLAGVSIGLGEVLLMDEQIAQFEALGISSEWHSSALFNALMVLIKHEKTAIEYECSQPVTLNLDDLFAAIATQPLEDPAIDRGVAAIESLGRKVGVPLNLARDIVQKSESIHQSPTMNWFQELILGSIEFSATYQKKSKFQTESYLKLFDKRLLDSNQADKIKNWLKNPASGAAIMTNRPSNGPFGLDGSPDAEIGAALVGLVSLPLIGYGEITWLSHHIKRDVQALTKPAWPHALSAILAASGWTVEESLAYCGDMDNASSMDKPMHLQNCTITVFEDTPAGLVAVQEAGNLLNRYGLGIEVRKIGISDDTAKRSALSAQGAVLFPDINQALSDLDDLRTFPSNLL